MLVHWLLFSLAGRRSPYDINLVSGVELHFRAEYHDLIVTIHTKGPDRAQTLKTIKHGCVLHRLLTLTLPGLVVRPSSAFPPKHVS